MNKKGLLIALLAIVALAVAGAVTVNPTLAAGKSGKKGVNAIHVDVAEAGTRFVFDEAPVFEDDGYPAYGNSFVTEGYIYPEGTLTESNGVLANGEPEFPDLVIGKWICRGYFIGDGAHTTTGPWVVTTQIYEIDGEIITTEGTELSDVGVAGKRAITGGTGPFSRARGEMAQTLIGFNESMGVNLQVVLNVKK